jgi:hypothetical protein
LEASKVYSQFQTNDRRQKNIPVAVERRSGVDRRESPRLPFDVNLLQNKDSFAQFRKQQDIDATILSSVPPLDKVEEIQDCIKEKNYFRAAGIGLLLINSFRKDLQELKEFKNDIIKMIKDRKLRYEDHQMAHAFTKNTEMEKFKLFKPVVKIDKTLYETKIGQFLLKKFGMKDFHDIETGIIGKNGNPIYKTKIIGNKFAEILGRSFLRTPVLGISTLSLLEIPVVIKAKEHKKQIIKSTISTTSIVAGGAMLGAIGAYYPPFGFIGASIGAYLGYKMSEYINKKI